MVELVKLPKRSFITFRTSTISTTDLKRGYNDLTKYMDYYLTWLQVSESVQHQRNEVTMKDLIFKGNQIQNTETNGAVYLK